MGAARKNNRLSKEDYLRMISKYKKRRSDLKRRFGVKATGSHPSKVYQRQLIALNKRIKIWKTAIWRIDKRNAQLKQTENLVTSFLKLKGKLMGSGMMQTKAVLLAKKIFCKYCIESGIRGTYVSKFIGYKNIHYASRVRMAFSRSFKTNQENLKLWQSFKTFAL